MSTTTPAQGNVSGIPMNNEPADPQQVYLDKLMNSITCDGKPVTVWQMVSRLGNVDAGMVSAAFNKLTGEGTLAKFRVGFLNYYAPPIVALTGNGPTLRTIILDLFRNSVFRFRYAVVPRLKRVDNCSRLM
ncbi:MAG: hypothetical protein V3R96_07065 [Dehalococcoidales bacterium]